MWQGYENALILYHDTMIAEWINRGYKNSMELYCVSDMLSEQGKQWQIEGLLDIDLSQDRLYTLGIPHWLTDEFCSYHRATLLFKNLEWYGQFGWTEEPKYEYLWPTKVGK